MCVCVYNKLNQSVVGKFGVNYSSLLWFYLFSDEEVSVLVCGVGMQCFKFIASNISTNSKQMTAHVL